VESYNPFGETLGFNVRSKPRKGATLDLVGPTYTLSLLQGCAPARKACRLALVITKVDGNRGQILAEAAFHQGVLL
jgi:hypothetical protein